MDASKNFLKIAKKELLYSSLCIDYIQAIGGFLEDVTTIQVSKKVVAELKGVKQYPRQTYTELILEMSKTFKAVQMQKNQYDEFLHKVQQQKMKELWDNKADEAWEKA